MSGKEVAETEAENIKSEKSEAAETSTVKKTVAEIVGAENSVSENETGAENAGAEKSDYAAELAKNGAIAFVPSGVSMWPTLKNRGQSVIVTAKKERLKRYDVALYIRAGNKYVLHRVMEATGGGYIICGDSQFALEQVKEEQVIGVMEGFYRGKKFISVGDEKYKKEVESWYGRKIRRKIRLKIFYFFRGIRAKLGRVARKLGFKRKGEKKSCDKGAEAK